MTMSNVTNARSCSWAALLALAGGSGACRMGNVTGDLRAEKLGDLSNAAAERHDGYQELAAACGDSAPPPTATAASPLRRRPYLQQVTDHSAQLVWTADGDVAASATVTTPDGTTIARLAAVEDSSVAALPEGKQWLASLDGLAPDVIYCYELGAGDGAWMRTGFRTAPAAGAGRPVRFVAFGDSGSGDADQYAVLAQMRTVPFDFVVHTGDIAYDAGTLAQFESRFFDVYADVLRAFPVFPASGNHEYETAGARPFRDVFSLPADGGPEGIERWYSFDWGDVHFVALDTERTGTVQAAWLDADLAANRRPWTVVYGHKPPFSSGEHGSDGAFRSTFSPVLEKHRVPLVLTGHDHHYERTTPQSGVTYIVTGGGGKGTRSVGQASFTAFSEAVIHFVYVEIARDVLALHAIDGEGTEFDSLVLRR